jgi:hypothetical protein
MRSRLFIGVFIPLAVVLAIFTGCGKREAPTAGKIDLLKYIPAESVMVMNFNVAAFTKLEVFDKLTVEKEAKEGDVSKMPFKSYNDFVQKTGIDPKTDVHYMTLAMFGKLGQKGDDGVLVANLKYDQNKLLSVLKENGVNMTEETYKDSIIYKPENEAQKEMGFSFISDGLLAVGNQNRVKQVIDLAKNGEKDFYKNTLLSPHLKKLKTDAIVSFIAAIPEEAKNQQTQGVPIKVDMSKVEAIYGFGNYKNDVYAMEMVVVSKNEEGNKETVDSLNQLKGMGAMAGPEVGELVNNLKITASAEDITFSLSVSGALLNKLMEKAKGKVGEN